MLTLKQLELVIFMYTGSKYIAKACSACQVPLFELSVIQYQLQTSSGKNNLLCAACMVCPMNRANYDRHGLPKKSNLLSIMVFSSDKF